MKEEIIEDIEECLLSEEDFEKISGKICKKYKLNWDVLEAFEIGGIALSAFVVEMCDLVEKATLNSPKLAACINDKINNRIAEAVKAEGVDIGEAICHLVGMLMLKDHDAGVLLGNQIQPIINYIKRIKKESYRLVEKIEKE